MAIGSFLCSICLAAVVFLIPALALADPASSSEPVINEKTSCPVAVKAMDLVASNNNDENHSKMSPVIRFIKDTMEALDRNHTENGEPGIVSQLSDEGFNSLVAFSIEHCREHPKMTIYNSAAYVYTGTREMELGLGSAR